MLKIGKLFLGLAIWGGFIASAFALICPTQVLCVDNNPANCKIINGVGNWQIINKEVQKGEFTFQSAQALARGSKQNYGVGCTYISHGNHLSQISLVIPGHETSLFANPTPGGSWRSKTFGKGIHLHQCNSPHPKDCPMFTP